MRNCGRPYRKLHGGDVVGSQIGDCVGNPVYLVMKGYDGSMDRLFGFLFQSGRRFYFRTGGQILEINTQDVLEIMPFSKSKNYYREALRGL